MVWVITATENDKKTPCKKGMKKRFKNLKDICIKIMFFNYSHVKTRWSTKCGNEIVKICHRWFLRCGEEYKQMNEEGVNSRKKLILKDHHKYCPKICLEYVALQD